MASITSTGIGSGLDVSGLVSQLVAAEGQGPGQRIAQGEARAQATLSAYGSLKSALSSFRDKLDAMRDIDEFLTRKASSANEDIYSVSAATGAVPASYQVEVVGLATAQRLTSGAFAADANVGSGTLSVAVGGATFAVAIDGENSTLADIRDAINDAPENTGVAATVVNAENGSYLVLAAEKTGVAQSITVTQSDGDGGLAALAYDPLNGLNALTETTPAADADIRIDGLTVTDSGNSIGDAIEGVTIDLAAADPGNTHTLTVANDSTAVRAKVEAFVSSYNQLVSTFDQLTSFDPDSGEAGALLGDSLLRGVRDQLRREMSVSVNDLGAGFSTLHEIGVELELDGTLKINATELDAVLADDFSAVGRVFASDSGFAVRLFDRVDAFVEDDGIITSRTEGLDRRIETFGEQRDRLNERLASLETRLLRQFNALDLLVSRLSSTSNFLSQQLASLPTPGGGNR